MNYKITKSSNCKSDSVKGYASKPYKSTGKHSGQQYQIDCSLAEAELCSEYLCQAEQPGDEPVTCWLQVWPLLSDIVLHSSQHRSCGYPQSTSYLINRAYSSLQAGLPSPLRKLTYHMGLNSVTCHPAEVTFPPLPQPELVLYLATPEGCKAELT